MDFNDYYPNDNFATGRSYKWGPCFGWDNH
jgi:hypothetical protein